MRCILFPLVYAYMRDCNVYCGIVSCNSRHESRRVMCSNRLRRVLPTVNQRVTEYAKVKAWQHTASAPITTLVEATTNSYHTYATHATTVSSQKNKRTTLSQRSPPCARSILILASIRLVNIHLGCISHTFIPNFTFHSAAGRLFHASREMAMFGERHQASWEKFCIGSQCVI